jgi:hypothetical protein
MLWKRFLIGRILDGWRHAPRAAEGWHVHRAEVLAVVTTTVLSGPLDVQIPVPVVTYEEVRGEATVVLRQMEEPARIDWQDALVGQTVLVPKAAPPVGDSRSQARMKRRVKEEKYTHIGWIYGLS